MNDWIEMKDFLANLQRTISEKMLTHIESWLRQHWLCRPGPQIIHKYDLTVQGICGCGEKIKFTGQPQGSVPFLDAE